MEGIERSFQEAKDAARLAHPYGFASGGTVGAIQSMQSRIEALERALHSAMLRNQRCPWCDGAVGLHGDNDLGHLDGCEYRTLLGGEE